MDESVIYSTLLNKEYNNEDSTNYSLKQQASADYLHHTPSV